MDWLTRLPVIGPVAAWFFKTRLWRVYLHLDARKWTRLAAALTFTSFLALFPILAVAAAVGAATLTPSRMQTVQDWMANQIPGISDQLNLQSLVDNASTVGVVAGVLLLFTGVGWAGTLREVLRAMWDLEEDPGNPIKLKLRDLGVLVGLGVVGLVSMAGSVFAVTAVRWTAEAMNLTEGGIGTVLLRIAGYAAAVAVDFVLLCYVLTLLPRVSPPRRATYVGALIGAIGFELLKALLGGYLQGVAAKSMYGAFGVPIALLLWISFMAKLLLFCSAWTATEPAAGGRTAAEQAVAEEAAEQETAAGQEAAEQEAAGQEAAGQDGRNDERGDGPEAGPGPDVRPGADGGAPGRDPGSANGGAPRNPPPPAGPEHRP